ncbi:ribonuclease HII [Paenibacillus montaniterrae]|uniref:Ribonuclease HII n=1 Tax=Paenibacillus montaniterrae TaxID=429341 RepID=A0A920CWR7_9BACL|nr:ribonuclease HII [Paenibacillus montaniterrae]GIP14528.1 ribonuclease HII [Paenibacillus montaniterrae]
MNEVTDQLAFEKEQWQQGVELVAGVDEVGRGCLFGDVVAAAVILPRGCVIEGIDDSKKLTEKKREQLFQYITETAVAYHITAIPAKVIDQINIKQAARLAMKLAVEGLSEQPKHILVDAETLELPQPQQAIIKGDARSQSIGAASILAKVTRDRLCQTDWHERFPQYELAKHKGYATKLHNEMILQHGPSPMHRKTFLRKLLGDQLDSAWENMSLKYSD